MKTLLPFGLVALVIVAIVKSKSKAWTVLYIFGWTFVITAIAIGSGYLLCFLLGSGNGTAVSGDFGIVATNLTLIVASILEIVRGESKLPQRQRSWISRKLW